MWKRILALFLLVIVGLAAAGWWLLFSSAKAPRTAAGVIDIEAVRTLAASPAEDRPRELTVLEIGYDAFPNLAIQAGRLAGTSPMTFHAVLLELASGTIVIDGAIDAATSEQMSQGEDAVFDRSAYQHLLDEVSAASQVLMTHEHLDHVMAIARHPRLDELEDTLVFNAPQIETMPQFMEADHLARWNAIAHTPRLDGGVQAVAPGVVIIPSPGHTRGSQMVFVSMSDGREILLIGDIVWNMSNIEDLTTRPRLTQFFFDPNEQREQVKAQVRALHDLMAAEPDIIIVPAHDRVHIEALAASGAIDFIAAQPD